MNVIALLKDDHRTVEKLFEKYEDAEQTEREQKLILDKITEDLNLHAAVEEEIVYPEAKRRLEEGEELVGEAVEEHAKVKKLLAEIQQAKGAELEGKVHELKECVEHHVEEEEGELFPLLEHAIDAEELEEIGETVMRRKSSDSQPRTSSKRKATRRPQATAAAQREQSASGEGRQTKSDQRGKSSGKAGRS
jgi:hemerythrin superfamily protein